MSWQDSLGAQLTAAIALVIITWILFSVGLKRATARRKFTFTDPGGDVHDFEPGDPIGTDLLKEPEFQGAGKHVKDFVLQRGIYFRSLYAGQDGRWSTSKIQPLLWTYAVVFGLLSILCAKFIGASEGWDAQLKLGLQEEYLILLGGPFTAAVLARAFTVANIAGGSVDKPEVEHPPGDNPIASLGQGVSEVVSDDDGSFDLGDFQYFLFNLLALTFFVGTFTANLEDGLPRLPHLLVGLTGVSAAAYVAKKATEGASALVTVAVPAKAAPGSEFAIWGQSRGERGWFRSW